MNRVVTIILLTLFIGCSGSSNESTEELSNDELNILIHAIRSKTEVEVRVYLTEEHQPLHSQFNSYGNEYYLAYGESLELTVGGTNHKLQRYFVGSDVAYYYTEVSLFDYNEDIAELRYLRATENDVYTNFEIPRAFRLISPEGEVESYEPYEDPMTFLWERFQNPEMLFKLDWNTCSTYFQDISYEVEGFTLLPEMIDDRAGCDNPGDIITSFYSSQTLPVESTVSEPNASVQVAFDFGDSLVLRKMTED